jgi:hypothetical protein
MWCQICEYDKRAARTENVSSVVIVPAPRAQNRSTVPTTAQAR